MSPSAPNNPPHQPTDGTLILGIETSCDETAASIVEWRDGAPRVLSNVVSTQHEIHARYAGVVPELASRAHLERIVPVVREALRSADLQGKHVSAVAVGNRPGLIGSLLVGNAAAKAYAWSLGIPVIGIDHIAAHLVAGLLDAPPVRWPALGLVASGGHTHLFRMNGPRSTPPMSMPHLDLRIINGEKILMFGPFASFTSKFLISGSFFDLISSVKFHNLKTLCIVFLKEWPLLIYLIKQNLKTHKNRMSDLRQFYPDAKSKDWHLEDAGIRVQIMKKTKKDGPKLEFGTEIIYSKQNNLAALLGASPGASISVQSMIHVVEKCLIKKERLSSWKSKIKKMIPSYDLDLEKNPKLLKKIRSTNQKILGINY